MWTATWIVVAWTVVGGGAVLAGILIVSAHQARRDDRRAEALRIELAQWGHDNGWSAADTTPPELTASGLDEVVPEERRRFTMAGSHTGRPAAISWCDWSDNDTDRKYATLLVQLPHPYPTLRFRHRQTFLRRTSGADGEFHRQVTVQGDDDGHGVALLVDPVRAALLRLRSVSGWPDEFARLDGSVLRVVMNDWPRPQDVDGLLAATADVISALPALTDDDRLRPSGPPRSRDALLPPPPP